MILSKKAVCDKFVTKVNAIKKSNKRIQKILKILIKKKPNPNVLVKKTDLNKTVLLLLVNLMD